MKVILGFTGSISSGKGTATRYLVEKYNAKSFKFSKILRDILDRIYLLHTRDNLIKISIVIRDNFGQDILAKIISKDILEEDNNIIVIDGIRRPADIKYLKDIKGFKLIGIDADIKIRYERLKKRNENKDDKSKSWEDFLKDQKAETEIYIPELLKKSNHIINNNGNLEELYKKLDNLIN